MSGLVPMREKTTSRNYWRIDTISDTIHHSQGITGEIFILAPRIRGGKLAKSEWVEHNLCRKQDSHDGWINRINGPNSQKCDFL